LLEQARSNRARLDVKWAAEKARRAERGPYVMLGGFAILGLALAAIIGLGWWGVSALTGSGEPEIHPPMAAPATPTVNRMEEKRLMTIKVGCNVADGLRFDIATMNEESLDNWNMQAFMEPYDAVLQIYADNTLDAMLAFADESYISSPAEYDTAVKPILRELDLYIAECHELLDRWTPLFGE
jgi:hypothetical protein